MLLLLLQTNAQTPRADVTRHAVVFPKSQDSCAPGASHHAVVQITFMRVCMTLENALSFAFVKESVQVARACVLGAPQIEPKVSAQIKIKKSKSHKRFLLYILSTYMDTQQFWEHTLSVAIGISLGYAIIKTTEYGAEKVKVLFNSPVNDDRLTRLEKSTLHLSQLLLQKTEEVRQKEQVCKSDHEQ